MTPVKSPAYQLFSEKGSIELLSPQELQSLKDAGIEPQIFLDSCVCLHIIRLVDYGKKAQNINVAQLISLKEYTSKNKIQTSPLFGLIELCSNRGVFDKDKFWDFFHRIKFFDLIPVKELKKFQYDFSIQYRSLRTESLNTPLENYIQVIDPSYCALLKIRSLALDGLSKQHAQSHLESYLNWMINNLDIILGIEYRLAAFIFGGRTEFRKMIGLDCKNSEIQKRLRGTAWDIFNAKNVANSLRLNRMLNENLYGIFMTSDVNLHKVFKDFNLFVIKDGQKMVNDAFLFNTDLNAPHFDDQFMKNHNTKMIELFVDRHNHQQVLPNERLNTLIQQLEAENGLI